MNNDFEDAAAKELASIEPASISDEELDQRKAEQAQRETQKHGCELPKLLSETEPPAPLPTVLIFETPKLD